MATLLVGPEEEKMGVQGDYLSRDSAFFTAALKRQWLEGQSRVIKLPEESPEPMQYYLEHVYSGKLPSHNLTGGPLDNLLDAHHELLAHLYVLGERRMHAKVQNAIIHEFFRLSNLEFGPSKTSYYPDATAIHIIYQGKTAE